MSSNPCLSEFKGVNFHFAVGGAASAVKRKKFGVLVISPNIAALAPNGRVLFLNHFRKARIKCFPLALSERGEAVVFNVLLF